MPLLPRCLRVLLPVFMAAWMAAAGAAETAGENALRAVLLFNLLKFSELPADPDPQASLDVCVATGDPDLLTAMRQIRDRSVRGRALAVHVAGEGADCDVLYVDSRARWQHAQGKLDTSRVLTVGLYAGFINEGGMVEMDFQQGRARFDINQAAARQAGIRFSPQLLRLARRIVE